MKLFTLIVYFLILIKYDKLASQDKINSEVLNISVNGLVCDFCARSIEKIFSKKNRSGININLENANNY